jgi:hypothetical protein
VEQRFDVRRAVNQEGAAVLLVEQFVVLATGRAAPETGVAPPRCDPTGDGRGRAANSSRSISSRPSRSSR